MMDIFVKLIIYKLKNNNSQIFQDFSSILVMLN